MGAWGCLRTCRYVVHIYMCYIHTKTHTYIFHRTRSRKACTRLWVERSNSTPTVLRRNSKATLPLKDKPHKSGGPAFVGVRHRKGTFDPSSTGEKWPGQAATSLGRPVRPVRLGTAGNRSMAKFTRHEVWVQHLHSSKTQLYYFGEAEPNADQQQP